MVDIHLHRFPPVPQETFTAPCRCGKHHPFHCYLCVQPGCEFVITMRTEPKKVVFRG